jgi:hypothetical protein
LLALLLLLLVVAVVVKGPQQGFKLQERGFMPPQQQ